jgi:hypothetical protein
MEHLQGLLCPAVHQLVGHLFTSSAFSFCCLANLMHLVNTIVACSASLECHGLYNSTSKQ